MDCELTNIIEDIDGVLYSEDLFSDENIALLRNVCYRAIRNGDDYIDQKISDYSSNITRILGSKSQSRSDELMRDLLRRLSAVKKQLATIQSNIKDG